MKNYLAKFSWLRNRLSLMSPEELMFRMKQAAQKTAAGFGYGLVHRVPAAHYGKFGKQWLDSWPVAIDQASYCRYAERLMAGKWSIFALDDIDLGFPPQWNRDPLTGIHAPMTLGKRIDYKDEQLVGNIKYLWEPGRHLEGTSLAQAYRLTGDPRYSEAFKVYLESWFEQCPYPNGVHWASSLELGIRLVNWAVSWYLLGGEHSSLFKGKSGEAFRWRLVEGVYRHCNYIEGNMSRHSSANNHLFGELMGLFVASLVWPLWPESAGWCERARIELEAEAVNQNAPDGTNREQAFWYHHEVADMMLLCLLFGRANGIDFSRQFRQRLESMLEFIAAVMDAGGHVPMVGDSDDAVMVRFSREPEFCPYRSLLATGAVLFHRGDFKAQARCFDDKSRWLLGDEGSKAFNALQVTGKPPARLTFPEGGYYVLGQDYGKPQEVKAIVDVGPLGYLSIAAHGHADALAFTLSVGGHEVLVDPGTFAYHSLKRWRDYFRGTSAHNTLRVDREEQSLPGGNFMWLTHARARCVHFESETVRDVFEGVHDGYLRLDDPVLHRRRIQFDKNGMSLEVRDSLECRGDHFVEVHWHLAERCIARSAGHSVHVECADVHLRVECPRALGAPTVVIGQEDPPLGWISRRLDFKVPSPVIVCAGRVACNTSLVTLITIEAGASRSQS